MTKDLSIKDLLLPYVVMVVVIFIMQDATYVFILSCIAIISLVFLIGLRIKDINICVLAMMNLSSILIENLLFSTGLISLYSDEENRLLQNSIIFGLSMARELLILVLLTYRVEITKWLFPKHQIRATFADSIMPWLYLIGAAISFFALIENYFRNGKGYDITFFFYAFEITGYLIFSTICAMLVALTVISYKEAYELKVPTIKKRS
ncbi:MULTISPECIES: hypothetical protein [Pseudoalteromonas]|nr:MULTISPECIES: hypothetical protein [Pseudoalteromonas]MCG7561937.1 hypothetical protein [Pseudoalteromonas sp. McH1-42]MEC4088459.1 hypothetical protein [Pseudoalteromonas rubra]